MLSIALIRIWVSFIVSQSEKRHPLIKLIERDLLHLRNALVQAIRQSDEVKPQRIAFQFFSWSSMLVTEPIISAATLVTTDKGSRIK